MTAITENCSLNEHAHLGIFLGSAEAAQLAQESHQIFHDIEPVLADFIRLTPAPKTTSLRDAMPKIVLYLFKTEHRPQTPTQVLKAFMTLVRHSMKLNAWPAVKMAFWSLVLDTMLDDKRRLMTSHLTAQPAFPQFVVWYGHPRSGAWTTVDKALEDTICEVMAEPADAILSLPASAMPSVELSFAYEWKTVDRTRAQMELIEQMLDRLFQSPAVQCKITSLDFSNTVMSGSLLEVATRIVDKCRSGRYQVDQVKLDGVLPVSSMNGYKIGDVPPAICELAARAFRVDSLPRVSSHKPPLMASARGEVAPSTLNKVSLSGNYLTPNFYPEHFSALRYGCVLQEDLTEYAISTDAYNPDIYLNCWRWLAFALFYPRPKRFADAYKLRSLGQLTLTPAAIRMIVNTVRNPVAQLLNNDLDGDDTTVAEYLMVCTVKAGANIEVFVSGINRELVFPPNCSDFVNIDTRPIVPQIQTLVETSEFEAIHEREDGSVCIVVPGAGLGWVAKEDVVLLEREPLDPARSAHDGRYNVSIRADATATPAARLCLLIESISHQFKSLTFDFDYSERRTRHAFTRDFSVSQDESVVQPIRDHCIHLKHLNVIDAPAREISDLLDALDSSELGARLLTLNLNDNRCLDDAAFVRLASIVGKTTNPLVLHELRVNHFSFSSKTIERLHDALLANRTLALIELYSAKSSQLDEAVRDGMLDEEACLSSTGRGQGIESDSPTNDKPAFLTKVAAWFKRVRHGRGAKADQQDYTVLYGMRLNEEARLNAAFQGQALESYTQEGSPELALDETSSSGRAASRERRRAIVWNDICDYTLEKSSESIFDMLGIDPEQVGGE